MFGWLNPAKLPPVATELNIVKHDLVLLFTRDLQAGGPHVARPSVFSGPRKHSGKIFKPEICRKACEVTFFLLNCLRWIKCI